MSTLSSSADEDIDLGTHARAEARQRLLDLDLGGVDFDVRAAEARCVGQRRHLDDGAFQHLDQRKRRHLILALMPCLDLVDSWFADLWCSPASGLEVDDTEDLLALPDRRAFLDLDWLRPKPRFGSLA